MLNVIRKPIKPKYSFFIPFTRKWMLPLWMNSFFRLGLIPELTEVIFYIDHNDQELISNITTFGKILAFGQFNGVKVYISGKHKLADYAKRDLRRERIIEMREKAKELITGEYIFSIEDDTICPRGTFKALAKMVENNPRVGFAEGVEVGRWGLRVIGAWRIKKKDNKITAIGSLLPAIGIEEIDAGGMYCFMSPSYLYKKHQFKSTDLIGPDMNYGLYLKEKGFKCLINWNIQCDHYIEPRKKLIVDDQIVQKTWIKKDNKFILEENYVS